MIRGSDPSDYQVWQDSRQPQHSTHNWVNRSIEDADNILRETAIASEFRSQNLAFALTTICGERFESGSAFEPCGSRNYLRTVRSAGYDVAMSSKRIPDTTVPHVPICWSCQNELPNGGEIMLTKGELPIPVCVKCWGVLPVSERLKIAQSFADREAGGVLSNLQVLIKSTFAQYLEQRGENWLGGGDN